MIEAIGLELYRNVIEPVLIVIVGYYVLKFIVRQMNKELGSVLNGLKGRTLGSD